MATSLIEVDRYVLCEPIAVGGMATVYFARQRGAAGFSKAVAIKRMRPDLVHQREFVDLFVDEARLASRVRHANVVSVTDVVASGDELLLVMEYFHGESLAKLLATSAARSRKIPPAIAIAIIGNVLHGLHAAHEAKGERGEPLNIVHRDVSPQNVLVGVDGVARVADFGIARAAGQIHATDEGKTRGKAGYSAPEQLRGGAVTRRIDLFAACALLWEVLVGRRLFEGETQAAVITSVLTEPIEAPGVHVPELSEALDEIIMRGLDRDPKKRPQTALELATLLEQAVTPAGPAAVAAWMTDLAREDLAKREEIVRVIEAGGYDTAPTASAPSSANDPTGSLATSRSPSLAPPPQKRSPVLPIALGLSVIVVLVLAIALARTRNDTTTTTASTPPPAASSLTSPAVADSAPAPAAAAASSEASATALPQSTSSAAKKTTPRAVPPTPKSKRCDPPYDIDPGGRKIFRVECL